MGALRHLYVYTDCDTSGFIFCQQVLPQKQIYAGISQRFSGNLVFCCYYGIFLCFLKLNSSDISCIEFIQLPV